MSVFGSLFTAVSGLSAQSSALSMISNNIANVGTIGYKEVNSAFQSLVTTQSGSTAYSPGSVVNRQSQTINQQGILQQSSSPTDVAISGNGFLVVKASTTDALAQPYYTRAGSFSSNAQGNLVNTAGYFLMGWPLDQNGAPPAGQSNISSLVPVNVAFLGGLTQPTSNAAMDLNLNSSATNAAYPVVEGTASSYSTAVQVYDSLGTGNPLNINFTKMASPTSSITGTADISEIDGAIAGQVGTFASTDSFTIQVKDSSGVNINSPAAVITMDGSVPDILSQINAIVDPLTNRPIVTAQIDPTTGGLQITANNVGDTLTFANSVGNTGNPLGAAGIGLGIETQFQSLTLGNVDLNTLVGDDNLVAAGFVNGNQFSVQAGANPALTVTITPTMDLTDMLNALNAGTGFIASIDNATGFLDIRSTNGDSVTVANVTGTPLTTLGVTAGVQAVTGLIPAPSESPDLLTPLGALSNPNANGWWNVTFTTASGAVVGEGAINFLGNGQLNATPTSNHNIPVELADINWNNGSLTQDITFNIAGLTQFASDYNVVSSTQNGAALGLQTGISIDSDGYVVAQFSNGQSQKIYQLPIATFSNPNGLNATSGNVYTQSDASGTYNLREASTGGAGTLSGGQLESSNVDLATEFAKMIVTQQAYAANSKVINTANQMTQSLLQIAG